MIVVDAYLVVLFISLNTGHFFDFSVEVSNKILLNLWLYQTRSELLRVENLVVHLQTCELQTSLAGGRRRSCSASSHLQVTWRSGWEVSHNCCWACRKPMLVRLIQRLRILMWVSQRENTDLLIDCSAQLLELCVLVRLSLELFLDETEELLDLLDKGLLDEDVSVLIHIILLSEASIVVRLTMAIIEIIWNISGDQGALWFGDIFVLIQISVVLYKARARLSIGLSSPVAATFRRGVRASLMISQYLYRTVNGLFCGDFH